MKKILWWLLAGTRGGTNRARLLRAIHQRPYNNNQLAKLLDLDFKTTRHHLELLLENGVLVAQGEGYGRVFFLSKDAEFHLEEIEKIWAEIGHTGISTESDEDNE